MEFLVRAEIRLPDAMPVDERQRLQQDEEARGRTLRKAGTIRRVWRLPGRKGGIALWDVSDAGELHRLLSSMPLWPWMHVHIEALAPHPSEATGDDDLRH